eukprot:4166369-Amphidinium_carterae.1
MVNTAVIFAQLEWAGVQLDAAAAQGCLIACSFITQYSSGTEVVTPWIRYSWYWSMFSSGDPPTVMCKLSFVSQGSPSLSRSRGISVFSCICRIYVVELVVRLRTFRCEFFRRVVCLRVCHQVKRSLELLLRDWTNMLDLFVVLISFLDMYVLKWLNEAGGQEQNVNLSV